MRTSSVTILSFALIIVGCKTVHTSSGDGVPVAVWSSLVMADQDGNVHGPQQHEIVSRVLRDHGLHPTIDDAGVSVPEGEERRAREVLLTDKRLAGSEVLVFLAIPAGSGRKTAAGFEIPEVAPEEPIGPSTTSPSK